MPSSIFDTSAPHGEASRLVAFSGNTIDRQSEFRSEDELPKAMAEESTRFFAITGDRLIMRAEGEATPVGLLEKRELDKFHPELRDTILLGRTEEGEALLAVHCLIQADNLPEPYKAIDARSVYRQLLMDQKTLGAYAQANSLVQWARSNRHCGRCGSAMTAEAGGYRRKCSACGHAVFPRTDPVVIMMVIDEENRRCLMGRSPHFPEGMYSCLAGFVEPGETIEDAVRRETLEESGIRVGRVRYHASQPWPIPHGGRLVANTSGFRNFDSLAVEASGNICIATLFDPGITVMTPDGSSVEHIPVPGDPYVTNICFGGADLKTAFITQSYYGNLLAVDWPRAGLPPWRTAGRRWHAPTQRQARIRG